MAQTCITTVLLLLLLACLPDPRRTQVTQLFDRLVAARVELQAQRLDPACGEVGEVGSRLSGEPGLTELRDAWPSLRAATDALLAACGNAALLAQPYIVTPAMLQARERWQAGFERQLRLACDELKRGAPALDRRIDC